MIPLSPRIVSVEPLDGFRLVLTFNNGEHGIFDCNEYLDAPAFRELNHPGYFAMAKPDHGTVVWPNGQDFCPDTLYLDAKKGIDQ